MSKDGNISLTSLVLMILATAFGFVNTATAYEQMGYASIIWYLVGAFCFFIPTSFMFAEYGSALSDKSGGIYSWIKVSIGERWAFIGTFIWLLAWIITNIFWIPNSWISWSAMIFGKDTTQQWSILGLDSTETLGILSIIFLIFATWLAIKGLKSITWIASIGGFMATLLVVIFCTLSIILIFTNHGHLAQPITGFKSFIVPPNPQFRHTASMISFVVYAIFAYAGIESLCGVINHLKNPKKTFPRAVVISMVIMVVLYTASILLCGVSINWAHIMGRKSVTLGNVMYVLMANVGFALGRSLNWAPGTTLAFGHFLVRFEAFATLAGGIGGFFVLLYSPIKSFMFGSSTKLWPKWALHLNKHGMPNHVMWIQTALMSVVLFFTSFGGSSAKMFYQILTDMNNVSTTLQYVLIVFAFPFFKKIINMNRPFEIYHSKRVIWSSTVMVLIVLIFGIVFNFIQPLLTHDYIDDFWTFIGPVLFGGCAWIFYDYDLKKHRVED